MILSSNAMLPKKRNRQATSNYYLFSPFFQLHDMVIHCDHSEVTVKWCCILDSTSSKTCSLSYILVASISIGIYTTFFHRKKDRWPMASSIFLCNVVSSTYVLFFTSISYLFVQQCSNSSNHLFLTLYKELSYSYEWKIICIVTSGA